ncbi:filamentous hemagglutinin N-terminal domain-containing protein [Campylobacter coli]|uniref:filamentous hemagglutinin N-terminal domain-containing protein n=2 Tax=Campylobacter coli TaxID=195 RepID=UPI0005766EE6|nr:filamentous hemagglutinin N-terminal domain-containing protein [Campylobacter coli]EAH4825216.1 filamentous hemagglutinin N-terminal domain-containing protein [Campylobacter coli]EAH5667293.1 filamentous hemagglutinin N-terminal domain-containing protein [Campylobacter coli]EAH7029468.1 filamentous hemagglutinin N-terminal domain-containing protein [Campylobacter coli]EAH7059556.1 filamentous hemagglutinin N-terminal domain-containing protein [Campylobacter coli]EAH8674128.1 filamentous hem
MNITNLLNIKHFLNTSSYFTNHLSKSLRVIVNISVITSLVLAQSLTASNLPSGGKFINGTGSIATNGNIMNITGDKTHNVIAWGGGFNIGKDNTVNFTTNGKNYLNLDYTNKASQILGTLNGGTNNVYIVNPSGVLVGEGATINANKFGVSTTPMGIDAINTFSVDGSFSPVFNANKGDVVNMGTIKANEIVLVGNKVENIKGTLQADKVDIKGDKVYLEDFGINSTHLKAEIGSEGFFKYEVKDVYDAYKDDSNLVDNYEFTGTATTNGNFKEYLYIGSQSASNEEMINSWKGFAKLVNEGIFGELKFKDVYLGKDIDFAGASTINPVGFGNGFVGNFYGNNHTLSNIQIDVADKTYVGLFGYIKGGSVQNLTIDGLQFPKYAFSYKYLGGLAGHIENGTFSNIALDTIEGFNGENSSSGGFAGEINSGTFNNISLKNLGNIGVAKYAGGFAGQINGGDFSSIILSNIESIYGKNNGGGFVGYTTGNTTFDGISLKDIRFIKSGAFTGGFAGMTQGNVIFENIVLNDLEEISGSHAGGFVGGVLNNENGIASLSNIVLNNIESIKGIGFIGGFAGWINDGTFNNIILNNIEKISVSATHKYIFTGGFTGYAGAGTYKNIILNNIGEISANGTASLDEKSIYAGGFAGRIKSDGINFSNIVLNDIDKISASIAAGGFVGNIENGSNIANSNIYFYGLLNSSSNKNYITHNENILNLSNTTDFQTFINQSKIAGLEYLTNTSTSNSHLHMINGGKIGNEKSKITFDKDNFTYNTPKISEVDPDGSGSSSSPTAPNEGELSSITLEQSDFEDEILKTIIDEILNEDYVLNIDSIDFNKFNEGDVAILLYLLKNTSDKKLKESLKQSLEFYTEFNKGGLKTEFEKWYGSDESTYKTSMGKYNYIIESLANLKEYVNTILKPELKSIKNNLNRLEFLKAEIKRLERVYQKAMQNDLLPYDQLEVVYKNTQEKIDAYYAEAQGLLDILKNKNKPFLDDLITKEYSFEDKYTDIQGTFAIAGSSIDANAIENLADKPILSLPENENSGDSQTTNNTDSTDIVNTFSKQVKLTSTESILILPAEETQSHIKEDERERGRVCITSDNAKTNNPCIAITF